MQLIGKIASPDARADFLDAFFEAVKASFPNIQKSRLREEFDRVLDLASKDSARIMEKSAGVTNVESPKIR